MADKPKSSGIYLRHLPANDAWAFVWATQMISVDGHMLFATREHAVRAAKHCGLDVAPDGLISSLTDDFTLKRLKKRAGNPAKKKRAKRTRKNPAVAWYILIQRGGHGHAGVGPVMTFNGKSFSNRPDSKPFQFSNQASAMYKARHLLGVHEKLSKYKIWVSDQLSGAPTVDTRVNPARRPNPAPSFELDEAAQKLEDFTGRPATETIKAGPRSRDKTGLVFGTLDLIGYQAKREGIDGGRMTRFVHKFRKSSRPLLAVSTDGKQLHIVGGRYEFTDAGIEDR
jgi:hypothetical protein